MPAHNRQPTRHSSRRTSQVKSYREDDDEDFDQRLAVGDDSDTNHHQSTHPPPPPTASGRTTRRGRRDGPFESTSPIAPAAPAPTRTTRRRVVVDPDEEDAETHHDVPATNGNDAMGQPVGDDEDADAEGEVEDVPAPPLDDHSSNSRNRRAATRHSSADAESFAPSESERESTPASSPDPLDQYEEDDNESFVSESPPRRRRTRASTAAQRATRAKRRADPDSDDEYGARPGRRSLRKRDSRPNYQLPPMDIDAELAATNINATGSRGRPGLSRGAANAVLGAIPGAKPLPWSMRGKDFAQAMGDPDSSDSDDNLPLNTGAGAGPGPSALGRSGAAPGPTDVPNFGRFNPKSSMADADPLGVDVNVTFDRVGGLDHHINQLKEMVALPLLYPELFQQFGIIPPRGVLFHGPPGTGKTLLARALAASCSNGNTKISFFMRKGADVLSKWVGEAERQLRMLFEEARASQPSIIFFDEIDGLAPVRSSKQDQIHASLVSTLLALMDGMDGRGQVIVIGATNRPDAVDPALRRPGRFDREFYFPLPNRDARHQIIKINTRNWEPQLPEDMVNTLATLTKGYGGADLRALCTEAALNAIQRRYPQIYKTTNRLKVEAGSVHVQPKDFMLAVKKIVPSSARSASSAAIQLPTQLLPLLAPSLEALKAAVDRALPPVKKRTALEEAEWEDEDGDSFEKEMMLQSLDKLRTYRPRLLLYGQAGSGQTYLGPAILHHLEGFHVQSFDLATLLSDSTRTPEAAIVQLFVEAKRHQPSIIFIPSLAQWASTLSETARATARALLDGIPPSDPVLVLAIVDGPLNTVPSDVRAWFGFGDENRLALSPPTASQRTEFFSELLSAVRRPPIDFPDGVPRKRRVLEELPLAEPLPPRQPTEAEVARENERDAAARSMLYVSFSSLVSEFMRKYRRPVAIVRDEALAYSRYLAEQAALEANPPPMPAANCETGPIIAEVINGDAGGASVAQAVIAEPPPVIEAAPVVAVAESIDLADPGALAPERAAADRAEAAAIVSGTATPVAAAANAGAATWQAHVIDMDIIQRKLVRHKYLTPAEFLTDIALIEENAKHTVDADRQIKISEMAAHARIHVQSFDQKWIPEFERYAVRTRERKAERAKAKEAAKAAEAAAAAAAVTDAATAEGHAGAGPIVGDADGANGSSMPDGSATEVNGLKRAWDGDEYTGREKRLREDDMDVDEVAPHANGSATPATRRVSPSAAGELTLSTTANPATGRSNSATPKPTARPSRANTPPASQNASQRASQSPEPHPPFTLPDELHATLAVLLTERTSRLTVEQLEQLRAALLDRVWGARTNWDRAPVCKDMINFVARYCTEVDALEEDD